MFRNLLPKGVFTRTFLFVHNEECLPTVDSIYSLFLFAAGEIVPVMRGSTNDNGYKARIFSQSLFIYTITIPTIPRLKRKKKQDSKSYIQTSLSQVGKAPQVRVSLHVAIIRKFLKQSKQTNRIDEYDYEYSQLVILTYSYRFSFGSFGLEIRRMDLIYST